MDNFSDFVAHLRPTIAKAYEVHAGDWLDTRGDHNIEERERMVSRIFAVERYNAFTVVLHREGQRALTVPTRLPLTVYRPIEELPKAPVCRCVAGTRDVCRACQPCQCSRWHGQTVSEDRLRAQVKLLQDQVRVAEERLAQRTGERDSARRALDLNSERVRRAREALL